MKLKYEMEILEMDNEIMAVPIGSDREFKGILRMSGAAPDIVELLKKETTEDEIITALLKEYDTTEEVLREAVKKIITILDENSLLVK